MVGEGEQHIAGIANGVVEVALEARDIVVCLLVLTQIRPVVREQVDAGGGRLVAAAVVDGARHLDGNGWRREGGVDGAETKLLSSGTGLEEV